MEAPRPHVPSGPVRKRSRREEDGRSLIRHPSSALAETSAATRKSRFGPKLSGGHSNVVANRPAASRSLMRPALILFDEADECALDPDVTGEVLSVHGK